MASLTKGTTYASGGTVTASNLNSHVDDAVVTFTSAGDTDDSTLEISSNTFRVKDDGITTVKIIDDAIDENKIVSTVIGAGLTGGSGTVISLDITGQTDETAVASDDSIIVSDTSAGAFREITQANFVSIGKVGAEANGEATALGSSLTKIGEVTLTLPTAKTWTWVKVVFSTKLASSGGFSSPEVQIGGTTIAMNDNWRADISTANSDDQAFLTFISEGIPTGETTTTSLTLEVFAKQGSGGVDTPASRKIYAVGEYTAT